MPVLRLPRAIQPWWGRAMASMLAWILAMPRAILLGLVCALLLSGSIRVAAGASPAASPPSAAPPPTAQAPAATPAPTWITLEGRRVLELRAVAGAQTLQDVAARGSVRLRELAQNPMIAPEAIVVRDDPPYAMVGLERGGGAFTPQLAVDDRAAQAFATSRQELAESYRDQMRAAIRQYRSTHSLGAWLRSTALAILVLGLYMLWIGAQTWLQGRLSRWIRAGRSPLLRGLRLGGNTVLDSAQEAAILQRLLRLLHWALLLLASYLLIPALLGFFPPTQLIAEGLRGHLRGVVGRLLDGAISAIPNLLVIALILLLTRLLMRACVDWFGAIERGRLQISGFYREWARPTGRLVSATVLLAGLVVAFPYIPGSSSRAFQGAGLFVGLLAALGSSAVATNVISGVMLIYTRAFQEGDRVEINGVTGVVQDRNLLVTRIQTPRNELVSLPNATVISSPILNFSFARRETLPAVAIATTITIGYDVPWRQVQALMLEAARSVSGIAEDPPPKVLQTALNDFHISYELNASLREVARYRETLSELLAALQDSFAADGVEILSPAYQANRDANASTVPPLPDRPRESPDASAGG
ncbi:MAG: mechanosensitive ion channel family protein [Cyanobium sp.]